MSKFYVSCDSISSSGGLVDEWDPKIGIELFERLFSDLFLKAELFFSITNESILLSMLGFEEVYI